MFLLAGAVLVAGCGKGGERTQTAKKTVITNGGSDTMVNLAQEWAEAYQQVAPNVSVEVSGGGSGVGVRDMMQGIVNIANCSRDVDPKEREQILKNTGKEPKCHMVGHDAIAIYVHKDNPVVSLSMEQLAAVFGEGGAVDKWSQIGVDLGAGNDEIIRISRQNSSGTYLYFREHVLAKKDFRAGSRDMSGSKDVVELVARTRGAIGYSGMGYATPGVRMVPLSGKTGEEPIAPSVENVLSKKYPLARSLHMVTAGEPEGAVKAYLDWVHSAGQAIVEKAGYVPLTAAER
jgi:phosphate transport system substrate-binding protein